MKYAEFSGDSAIIKLRDKLNYDAVSAVIEEIKAAGPQGVRHLDFYCGELQTVSAAGIRTLKFITLRIDPGVEMDVTLHDVPKPVKDMLMLGGMEGYANFAD